MVAKTEVYLVSKGRSTDWRDLEGWRKEEEEEEDSKEPLDSSESEVERSETDKSWEESLGEEASMAVLDEVLTKTKRDGGPMNEIIETMALLG